MKATCLCLWAGLCARVLHIGSGCNILDSWDISLFMDSCFGDYCTGGAGVMNALAPYRNSIA
jgi:hypothetical protein